MSTLGLSRAERIARNRAIAERFYDGYHGSVERGRLTNVFEPEDFAEDWVFCSPFLGGETHQRPNRDMADGAVANHAVIWQKIPDYKMDDLMVWPTERGCAWRWCVHGTGTDGNHYAFWEQLFLWTDDEGKVTRFEFYDDWHGFPQALVFAYGLSLDEFTRIEGYGTAPWTPGPSMAIDPPPAPPRDEPPANERVARNLALARQFFDGYHHSIERDGLHGVFAEDDLAEGWVLFSPWFGELPQPAPGVAASIARADLARIRERIPDYRMDHFEAWPTDEGCAWRWCAHGTDLDGRHREVWEQLFLLTDDAGRITRLERYQDWQGLPPTYGYATGLALDELWDARRYLAWITDGA